MGAFLLGAATVLLPVQTPEYYCLTGRMNGNITEANRKWRAPIAGTLSNFAVYCDAAGSNRTAHTRKDSGGGFANGNLSPTIPNTTAGIFRDDTHTDAVSAGDYWDVELGQDVSTTTWYWATMKFVASSGHVGLYTASGSATITPGITRYYPVDGDSNVTNTTESDGEMEVRVAGARKQLLVNLNTNTLAGGSTTVRSRVNGANGNISFTIAAGSGGGIFEDDGTQHDDLVSGDRICTQVVDTNSSGAMLINGWGTIIAAASGQASDVFVYTKQTRNTGHATTHYTQPVGCIRPLTGTSETERRVQPGFSCKIRNFRVKPSVNTYAGNCTVVLRKNGVDRIALTINSGSTSLVEDASSIMTLGPSDDFSISIVGGTSGNLTLTYFAYTLEQQQFTHALNIDQAVNRASVH